MPRNLGFLQTFPVLAALPTSVGAGRIVTLSTDGHPYFDHSTGWQRMDVQMPATSGDMLKATYDATGTAGIVDNAEALGGFAANLYARTDLDVTFAKTITATTATLSSGGQSLVLTPGAADHSYLGFYARTATPGTRSGYFGFAAPGNAGLFMVNQIGAINFQAVGDGVFNNGNLIWHAGNLTPGATMPVKTVTANYTVLLSDGVIFADATAGPVAITLPTATSAIVGTQGQRVRIKKIDTTANAVTITATGGQIDGAANAVISTPYNAFEFSPIPSTANWGGF